MRAAQGALRFIQTGLGGYVVGIRAQCLAIERNSQRKFVCSDEHVAKLREGDVVAWMFRNAFLQRLHLRHHGSRRPTALHIVGLRARRCGTTAAQHATVHAESNTQEIADDCEKRDGEDRGNWDVDARREPAAWRNWHQEFVGRSLKIIIRVTLGSRFTTALCALELPLFQRRGAGLPNRL